MPLKRPFHCYILLFLLPLNPIEIACKVGITAGLDPKPAIKVVIFADLSALFSCQRKSSLHDG
jgi:hypothetical protein